MTKTLQLATLPADQSPPVAISFITISGRWHRLVATAFGHGYKPDRTIWWNAIAISAAARTPSCTNIIIVDMRPDPWPSRCARR